MKNKQISIGLTNYQLDRLDELFDEYPSNGGTYYQFKRIIERAVDHIDQHDNEACDLAMSFKTNTKTLSFGRGFTDGLLLGRNYVLRLQRAFSFRRIFEPSVEITLFDVLKNRVESPQLTPLNYSPLTGIQFSPDEPLIGASQFRRHEGLNAWLFNPWLGNKRGPLDVANDPEMRHWPVDDIKLFDADNGRPSHYAADEDVSYKRSLLQKRCNTDTIALYNPYAGNKRDTADIGSDPKGILINPGHDASRFLVYTDRCRGVSTVEPLVDQDALLIERRGVDPADEY